MLPVSETIFWISFGILLYTYAGYPLILLILTTLKKKRKPLYDNSADSIYEPVTLLVAAYNEETIIEGKIKNCLSLDYPKEKIKFIFISDGSDDRTPDIINNYPVITHLHNRERSGKLAAVNRAMQIVDTPLVIFSDANTMLNRESISRIVRHYQDPEVGGVSGEKTVLAGAAGEDLGKGEGLYWKYESFLKKLDSRLYSVVGAAGELFSMRTALYTQLPANIVLDDFVQSLLVCLKGYIVRYEPEAFSQEKPSLSLKDEMERKLRITAGGFQAILFLRKLFNVFRHPVLTFQYVSHRVLRWTLTPVALVTLLAATIMTWYAGGAPFYGYFALAQVIFYGIALLGWTMAANNRHPGPFYLPFYFVFMHFSVFGGFARFIWGSQETTWKKAAR